MIAVDDSKSSLKEWSSEQKQTITNDAKTYSLAADSNSLEDDSNSLKNYSDSLEKESNCLENDLNTLEYESNTSEGDSNSKVNPEIELKERSECFIYKTDFLGHLQLVNLDRTVSSKLPSNKSSEICYATKESENMCNEHLSSNHECKSEVNPSKQYEVPEYSNDRCVEESSQRHSYASEQWNGENNIVSTSEERTLVVPFTDSENHSYNFRYKNHQKSNTYFVKNEPVDTLPQSNYTQAFSQMYNTYSSNQNWELNSNVGKNQRQKMALLTEAEKKRIYRMRLKEENPSMWSSIKKRDADRKRQQREKRRNVIYEMQKAMEYENMPHSSEAENNRLYYEALKERYPELWKQLQNALPATQLKNEQKYNERSSKSRRLEPKPVKLYKDVIEAHKKRLYRQKIKNEQPDVYERQKARDACSRSLQRFIKKNKHIRETSNGALVKSLLNTEEMDKKLTYLHNLPTEQMEMLESNRLHCATVNEMGNIYMKPHIADNIPGYNFRIKNDLPFFCDIKYASSFESKSSENSLNSTRPGLITSNEASHVKEASDSNALAAIPHLTVQNPGSMQSDVLWYWNDLSQTHPPDDNCIFTRFMNRIPDTEKRDSFKEQAQQMEKRKRGVCPEKRAQFHGYEREQLREYRRRKRMVGMLGVI